MHGQRVQDWQVSSTLIERLCEPPGGFKSLADLSMSPTAARYQGRPESGPEGNFHSISGFGWPEFQQCGHTGAQMGDGFRYGEALNRNFAGPKPERCSDTELLCRVVVIGE